jgi:cardiolipin synthase
LIIDGQLGFVGGMNISSANHAGEGDLPSIRDYHFAVRGPVVLELQYTFLRDWYYMTNENADHLLSHDHFPPIESQGNAAMRIVNAGPTSEREALCDAYFALIGSAQSQILLGTPYFVPPDDMRRALRVAALRGIDVRLLLPIKTNHLSTTYAARAFYEEMLVAGVRIFLRRPPFMHSKFMLVDGRNAMVGSANFDNRSLKLNYETTLVIFDSVFTDACKRRVLSDYAQADEIHLDAWRRRPASQRLVENFFNLASPAL